jgi:lysyl-tRNA synthetase class 2
LKNCLEEVARAVHGIAAVQVGANEIDFAGHTTRLSMYDSILKYTGIDVSEMDEAGLRETCADLKIEVDANG